MIATVRRQCGRVVAAMLYVCVLLAACSDGGSSNGVQTPGSGRSGRELHAVQVGAFADSLLARRLSDSLNMAGWQSYVSRDDSAHHRVRVSPSQSRVLTDRVSQALRNQGVDALAVLDTAEMEPLVEALVVNHGSHGMNSRVRWMLAPHGRSMLVVHDPSGVEAEAIPDGFIYASERDGIVVQRDSVWDVTPSPTWNKIAYGQAFVIGNGESVSTDSNAVDPYVTVATAANVPVDTIRAYAFLISGMVQLHAYARPVVVRLDAVDSATGAIKAQFDSLPVSGGWRIRWAPDSSLIAMGDAPIRVQDDSPPRNWLTVDSRSGEIRGSISQSRLVPPDWRLGPALDVSVPIDDKSPRTLRVEGASISSGNGWIRRDGKLVGPGVPLAATRDGRFIAALAPRVNPKDYESSLEPVVYKVGR